jgi:hypothetical protein
MADINSSSNHKSATMVPIPGGLYCKVHIGMMKMPKAGGFNILMQVCCMLVSYPEWHMLHKENTKTLSAFIFKELLCCWRPITKIVTDNAPAYKLATDSLVARYDIHPICILLYNSQANGIIEHCHHDVWETIMKTCKEDKLHWYQVVHSVFWAECVTIHKATGLSPILYGTWS